MTEVAAEPSAPIKLNQLLFGYDDGHRLLSGSQKLPDEAMSSLLLNSDLVPGVDARHSGGYWTGLPLPSARAYALMRTWPAPEMPRPGCVWTHVLLIALADMARFPDLMVLKSLFARPRMSAGYTAYLIPLLADPMDVISGLSAPPSERDSLSVLRALYTPKSDGVLVEYGESIETAIFAAWSQQWPRLRRAFSFRTAGFAADLSTSARFNLRVVREPLSSNTSTTHDAVTLPSEWERVAIEDLATSEPSPFRRFLWRYGSDIKRGRDRYQFLARLFLTTRLPALDGAVLAQTLDTVVHELPDAADGQLLKEDLLSSGRSPYSLLPPTDPIATISYFAGHSSLTSLPTLPEATFAAVHDLWADRAPEILSIAERAVIENSAVADELLDRLSVVAEPERFLALSHDHPIIQRRLIRVNPALLDSPDVAGLPTPELMNFLMLLPDDQQLAGRVLDRLIHSSNPEVVAFFADRFLDLTQDHAFDALVSEVTGSGALVPRVWPDTVRQRSVDLAARLLDRASTTTGLSVLARWLGLDVAAGLRASPSAWAAILLRTEDDVRGESRQRLLAYLLALALAQPAPGCEPLFERAFESVHADIWSSRLPYDAFDALSRYLPDLYWWQQWDASLRLRRAVVDAYVTTELDPTSFGRLTSDSSLRERLIDIASESKAGRRYLKRVVS